jgi:sigma-B regulation protein RsbU (phosphoserine phosphatase)
LFLAAGRQRPASRGGRVRKQLALLLLLLAATSASLSAQTADSSAAAPDSSITDRAHAQQWSSHIETGWRVHEGDDPAWANPSFNDSAWQSAELDDLGPSRPGWRWYRLHLTLHENHPDLSLLLYGGDGTYSLFVNGVEQPGTLIRSSLGVSRPTEWTIPLDVPATGVVLALRTHTPPIYANWHLPQFMTASIGTPDAIENQRQVMQSARMYAAFPAIAVNLLLILAGIGAFALYRSQPNQSEYLWLGLYLFLLGLSDLMWGCQVQGLLPLSANFFAADPLIYAATFAQIEFTYSFGGRRVGRAWRVYEILLLAPLALLYLQWKGLLPSTVYLLIEALIVIPVALLLPVFLLLWYRRGNREAGWLILPSLLPAAIVTLGNFGSISIFLGWHRLDFLDDLIPIGVAQMQLDDAGDLLFLLAIAVVIFFRFTRVSREQARSAAELEAAREIQQRLVPAALPEFPGFHFEAAYLPAQEVGGDFYQIIAQQDGYALIVVGDVSGKGLKAAMTGALAIGALRTLADENLSPGVLLARLNRQMLAKQESGFITCLCVRMSLDGSLTMANAGHLSPYRRGEEIELDSGLPLGLTADAEYPETQLELAPGDTLTLLSDGVVEAMDAQHQLFGFERTRAISIQSAHNIATAAQAFGQEDDITVLTLKRIGTAERTTPQESLKRPATPHH